MVQVHLVHRIGPGITKLSGKLFCRSLSSSTVHLNLICPTPQKYKSSILPNPKFLINELNCKSLVRPNFVAKMATNSPMIVKHDKVKHKFFLELEEGEAKIEYAKKGDTLNMWHTEVPVALRGQGIAKILAEAALSYAVENNHKMILACPYLKKYYEDNPKEAYKNLVIG